jgi:hypothetical protein
MSCPYKISICDTVIHTIHIIIHTRYSYILRVFRVISTLFTHVFQHFLQLSTATRNRLYSMEQPIYVLFQVHNMSPP